MTADDCRSGPGKHSRQHGAALITALMFLIIFTLLGLAAMRAGVINMRLAQDDASRTDAKQNAQSAVDAGLATLAAQAAAGTAVLSGSDYAQYCYNGSSVPSSATSATQTKKYFGCSTAATLATPSLSYSSFLYISIYREQPGSADYLPVTAARSGDSSDRYNLALFTITGGYDRTAITTTNAAAQGAAEIAQGVTVKVAKIKGLTQQ